MLHAWMYRFSFPGFAQTEWVLPEGVEHDEAWYEPLPWNMACQDLGAWSLDPALEDKLRELHLATFGEPLTEPAGVPFHALMEPLRGAFERGELVAWVLRVNTVQHPAQLASSKPKPRPQEQKKTWIEIVLVDQNGIQVPNEPYRLTPVDGEPRKGELDERGFARVEGIVPGPCDVTFPRIDGREWSESGPSLEGDLREDGAPVTHVVREGECMSSIAAKNRFRSWSPLHTRSDGRWLLVRYAMGLFTAAVVIDPGFPRTPLSAAEMASTDVGSTIGTMLGDGPDAIRVWSS